MTNEQEARMMQSIAYHKQQLQAIEQGTNPDTKDLDDRRKHAGWQVEFLLKRMMEALPAPLHQEVQACLTINDRLWSADYCTRYFAEQEKASPVCLAASDSL